MFKRKNLEEKATDAALEVASIEKALASYPQEDQPRNLLIRLQVARERLAHAVQKRVTNDLYEGRLMQLQERGEPLKNDLLRETHRLMHASRATHDFADMGDQVLIPIGLAKGVRVLYKDTRRPDADNRGFRWSAVMRPGIDYGNWRLGYLPENVDRTGALSRIRMVPPSDFQLRRYPVDKMHDKVLYPVPEELVPPKLSLQSRPYAFMGRSRMNRNEFVQWLKKHHPQKSLGVLSFD